MIVLTGDKFAPAGTVPFVRRVVDDERFISFVRSQRRKPAHDPARKDVQEKLPVRRWRLQKPVTDIFPEAALRLIELYCPIQAEISESKNKKIGEDAQNRDALLFVCMGDL